VTNYFKINLVVKYNSITFTSSNNKEMKNTTFTILKANENGEMEVLFSEIKRTETIPFSLKNWFTANLGEETKFTMWTEGDEEVTVLGRGGKMAFKFQ